MSFNKACFLLLLLLTSCFATRAQQTFFPLRSHFSSGLAVGSLAPDFTVPDAQGKPVALHDFRGRYVLVDFWASWCGPCRAESPLLVAAFRQYRTRNFTILGVATLRPSHATVNRAAWLQAIETDGLAWQQAVGDSTLRKLYAVAYIPQNVLVDPAGRIVARNIKGKHLQRKLAALLPAGAK